MPLAYLPYFLLGIYSACRSERGPASVSIDVNGKIPIDSGCSTMDWNSFSHTYHTDQISVVGELYTVILQSYCSLLLSILCCFAKALQSSPSASAADPFPVHTALPVHLPHHFQLMKFRATHTSLPMQFNSDLPPAVPVQGFPHSPTNIPQSSFTALMLLLFWVSLRQIFAIMQG